MSHCFVGSKNTFIRTTPPARRQKQDSGCWVCWRPLPVSGVQYLYWKPVFCAVSSNIMLAGNIIARSDTCVSVESTTNRRRPSASPLNATETVHAQTWFVCTVCVCMRLCFFSLHGCRNHLKIKVNGRLYALFRIELRAEPLLVRGAWCGWLKRYGKFSRSLLWIWCELYWNIL